MNIDINIFLSLSFFVLGCILLYFCSNSLIDNSTLLSYKFNLSPIVVGATIIAIGTSLPELLVSIYSIIFLDISQASSIIIGNILGSNIANIALVLGFCAFLYKIIFESNVIKDLILIFLLGIYAIICLHYEFNINYFHGIFLLAIFSFYLYNLIISNQIEHPNNTNISINIFYVTSVILSSIIGLSIGTNLAVENALIIADKLGFGELSVGLSIIALGTSLPELFTSLAAIKRKNYNLLIGNIIGSNIINIVFVLGVSSLFSNIYINRDLIASSLPYIAIIFIASHLVIILSYVFKKSISNFSGLVLLILYLLFLYKLF